LKITVANPQAGPSGPAWTLTAPIPSLDYAEHLWHERHIKSVANVTAQDAREFLPLAAKIPIKCCVQEFELAQANEVLIDLKNSRINGAAILRIPQ